MKSGIYLIKNNINNKLYIGSSVDVKKRLYKHKWKLNKNCHDNIHLQRAWNKDGKDNFSFKKYLNCEIKDLIFYEQLIIDAFIIRYGRENIYNICLVAYSTLGRKHSEETKKKISLKSKGRWTGKHHTEKTKRKMSIAQTGRIITKDARKKLSIAMKGKPGYWLGKKRPHRSKEWQEKITASVRGHKMPEHVKEILKKVNTGRVSPFKGKPGTRLGIKNKKKYE